MYSGWTWFLLSGSSESRGKLMAHKWTLMLAKETTKAQGMVGTQKKGPLKADRLEAESWRTWPGSGMGDRPGRGSCVCKGPQV